ncbi:MAG TPA: hypothetical protein VH187_22720 [Scandinavium sp.]|uniref:helix-turn-helix transcriptional regulator n=1 Tax=Scandinavium sp. TaxID=2830653 RepID=UPI002E36D751|nr:hypothetical protein [Scandinavium sp.]HEX4503949.1 hypothetical protein [Scandinavium sp.]
MKFTVFVRCVFTRIAVHHTINEVTARLGVDCTIYDFSDEQDSIFDLTEGRRIHVLCDNHFDYLNVQKSARISTLNIIPKSLQRLNFIVEKSVKSEKGHNPVDIYTILTRDERLVIDSLLAGYTQKHVALCNGTSIQRISARKRRAMLKLGARTDQELFYLYSAHKNLHPVL